MKLISLADIPHSAVSHNPKIKKKVMIKNGEVANIINFSQAVIPVGEVADAHSHSDMTEVFRVESGEGIIWVDARKYLFVPGVCAVVAPNEVHEIKNTGNEELVITYFGVIT